MVVNIFWFVIFMLLCCQNDKEVTAMPNTPHKYPHYALRIPSQTMDKLKYIAAYNGRSANKEIEQLILKHISNFEEEHGSISFEDFSPRSRT